MPSNLDTIRPHPDRPTSWIAVDHLDCIVAEAPTLSALEKMVTGMSGVRSLRTAKAKVK